MPDKITLKYITGFENNQFLYSNNFDLSNVIDLKKLHDTFNNYKYITNGFIIEQRINNETKILYRLINGEIEDSNINYLHSKIKLMPYDISVESVFDVNELIINIVSLTIVSSINKTIEVINEIIEEYEESKKIKNLVLF